MTGLLTRKPGKPAWTAALLSLFLLAGPAGAQTSQVRIGYQFGFQYIPLMVMKHRQLLEKHAEQAGLGNLQVSWLQFSGGGNMNDALLSNNLDFGELGVGPFVQMWSKTRGKTDVKAVAATGSMPMTLTSNNPRVKSLQDLTDQDRIALPTIKSSMQAITLQMAAAQIWGEKHYDRLDKLTVSMKHPDAAMAMLTGKAGITAHFTVPPFSTQELDARNIHKVLDSYQIYGAPATINVIYATSKFRQENPKLFGAFLAALKEATSIAQNDRKAAGEAFMQESKAKMDPAFVAKVLHDPAIQYTTVPSSTFKLAQFMARVGIVPQAPQSWKDMFFPEIYDQPGS